MVKERGLELEYVGEEAKNYLQVVKAAIKQSPSAVKHAGKALLKNPESVIELLRETGYTYDVLNDRFKNNESFFAEALMGYISRGGKLTDETGYDYQYYDDEPPYWITTELFNIIDANRQLIAEKIKKKNIFYDSTDYSQALSEETIQYLEGLLEKYKTCEDKKRNNGVVVTHFGDDLDSKGAIYAIENWLRTQGLIDDDMRIILQRIPAGQAKETHDISEVAEAVDGVTLDEYNATATETRDGMKPTPEIGKKGLKHDDDDEQSI